MGQGERSGIAGGLASTEGEGGGATPREVVRINRCKDTLYFLSAVNIRRVFCLFSLIMGMLCHLGLLLDGSWKAGGVRQNPPSMVGSLSRRY